jgi:hypothetical protein
LHVWNVAALPVQSVELAWVDGAGEDGHGPGWDLVNFDHYPDRLRGDNADAERAAAHAAAELATRGMLAGFLGIVNGDLDAEEVSAAALRVYRRWDDLWRGSSCVTAAWLLASTLVQVRHTLPAAGVAPAPSVMQVLAGCSSSWLWAGRGMDIAGGHLSPLVEWGCHRGYLAFDPEGERVAVPLSAGHVREVLGSLVVSLGMLVDRQAANALLGPSAVWSGMSRWGDVSESERSETVVTTKAMVGRHNAMLSGTGFWSEALLYEQFSPQAMRFGEDVSVNRFPVWFWPLIWGSSPYSQQREAPSTASKRRVLPRGAGVYPRHEIVDLTGYVDVGSVGYVCFGAEDGVEQPRVWIRTEEQARYSRPTWYPWDLGFDANDAFVGVRSMFTVATRHLIGERMVTPFVEVTRVTSLPMLATVGSLTEPSDALSSDSLQQVVVTERVAEALGAFRL